MSSIFESDEGERKRKKSLDDEDQPDAKRRKTEPSKVMFSCAHNTIHLQV